MGPERKFSYDLTFEEVIRILRLIDESPFREVHLELGDLRIHVVRGEGRFDTRPAGESPTEVPSSAPITDENTVRQLSPAAMQTSSGVLPRDVAVVEDNAVPVTSPLAGVFYRAPAPDKPPYVEAGAFVKTGDVIGLIEVMKLMNEIKAPCEGVLREFAVRNEQFVEFGQVLAYIVPTRERARSN
jgi:acetyl-CoA carboxylase biotin carboxyl carrier protein